MPIIINLRHLDHHNLCIESELSVEELDIDTRDKVIRLAEPLRYRLEVQRLDNGLLVEGKLALPLQCQCVRCLKTFRHEVKLPQWTCHLPFSGEDAVPVVNDMVDLTPAVREDILLEFPQHPLCDLECAGLPIGNSGRNNQAGPVAPGSSAWAELNKLKL
jgi:uncharacterized metal-binding protein YceD (DUF177 family)